MVTGSAKGLRLEAPGAGTRPLTDRLKQSLFSALAAESGLLDGGTFLDLFAGSGAAGIEALSRGASRAVFVEQDGRACRVIADNLRRAELTGGVVVRSDVLLFLRTEAAGAGAPFDACLADPPYSLPLLLPTLGILGERRRAWLSETSIVVAKHFWRDAPPESVADLRTYRRRRSGETMLSFYRLNGSSQTQEGA